MRQAIGEDRGAFNGNLRNLFVDVEMTDGDGSLLVFTSSVDNGTGDQILKTD